MASIDEEARELAQRHYELEEGMQQIIQLKQDVVAGIHRNGEPVEKIGLLEVNEYTVPSGIMPLEFAPVPASGVNYPTMIVEVTPEEYARIRASELALPDGWSIGDAIPRRGAPK
jgi:hypothetical protein